MLPYPLSFRCTLCRSRAGCWIPIGAGMYGVVGLPDARSADTASWVTSCRAARERPAARYSMQQCAIKPQCDNAWMIVSCLGNSWFLPERSSCGRYSCKWRSLATIQSTFMCSESTPWMVAKVTSQGGPPLCLGGSCKRDAQ